MRVDETQALRLTLIGLVATMSLFAAEYIVAMQRGMMGTSSLMAWDIYALQSRWVYRGWRATLLNTLFRPQVFACVVIVRVLLAALAVALVPTGFTPLPLVLLLALTMLVNLRHSHGRDGADDLTTVLVAGLLTYSLPSSSSPLRWAGLIFVITQVSLSYFVSGVAKLISVEWRTGEAIIGVFSTNVYGFPPVVPWLRSLSLRHAICWSIIAWETTFPLYWVVPAPLSFGWLVAGVLFHMGSAVLMGLNTFLVVFLSTYPLLVYLKLVG
jgi:hypothetical protein